MIVNRQEIIHHESTVCEYRKVKCHSCLKIEEDVEEMKEKMEEMKGKMEGVDEKRKGMETKIEEKMGGMAADMKDLKRLMMQMFEKLRFLENTIQISSAVNYASTLSMEFILVAGGTDNSRKYLKSVGRFSWKKNVWERVSTMNVGRIGATSFVHENQVFVTGGCNSPVIEVLNLNEDSPQWEISEATLPFNCGFLISIGYQNRRVLFCACGKNDYCTELCLTPPYICNQLCEMPEPPRIQYTVVAFEHKVLIFGGKNANDGNFLEDVSEFDFTTMKFKILPSLPRAVVNMAGVRWGDQAVLIGGFGKNGPSKKVFMYDSKTGNITELPSLLKERTGCAAVITGNTIVVMGGMGKSGRVRSVEAFTLGGYSWRYLPAMKDIRSAPIATVLSTQNFH